MIDLEQMRKDMEAGTQGDWQIAGTRHAGDLKLGPNARLHWVGQDQDPVCGVFFDMITGKGLADARRIARLPQLEREYIALREAADALAEVIEDYSCFKVEDKQRAIQALAAYYEATK